MSNLFKEEDLKGMPALYEQDGKGENAVVYFVVEIPFSGFCWLLTEYSEEEDLFFGFACLNDIQCAELGYISKSELEDLGKRYSLKALKVEMTLKEAKEKYIKEV